MKHAWLALALVACGASPPKKASDPPPAEPKPAETQAAVASTAPSSAPPQTQAAPDTTTYDDDFRKSLASSPQVFEGDVKDDDEVIHFRVSLPASLKEQKDRYQSPGSKSWKAQRIGGFTVTIGVDEPKKFATQLNLSKSSGRKLVEQKETKDGWWLVGASENVVEAVRGMKTKSGKTIVCRAEVLHPDAPKEKKAIFPKLRALCASLEA